MLSLRESLYSGGGKKKQQIRLSQCHKRVTWSGLCKVLENKRMGILRHWSSCKGTDPSGSGGSDGYVYTQL